MDQVQACKICLSATCEALTANNTLLETQVTESNETNSELQNLTTSWTSDLHQTSSTNGDYNNVSGPFTAGENPFQALQTLLANPSDANMETYINTYLAPAPGSGNTTNMGDFSSALVIQILGALDNTNIWNTNSGSDSVLQMNAINSFLSVVSSDGTNDETPYQTISRNLTSAIQQNSGQSSTIAQIGANVNQANSSTISILNSPY
jgi:hypothetical protein